MPTPVFEEYEPAGDCACPGCAQRRRALARGRAIALRDGGTPAVRGARRALVLATAAGVVLGGGGPAAALLPDHAAPKPRPAEPLPAEPLPGAGRTAGTAHGADARPVPGPGPSARDTPGSPQGGRAPLHGRPRPPASGPGRPGAPSLARRTDRATIINRAKLWLEAQVPYSMSEYWTDGYRQDCSGYVSMAWNLGTNEWTGSLDTFATKITKDELLPGDMLLFHNPADPNKGSHVVLFGGWVDETHTHYIAYEQTPPVTRRLATPYGYWNNGAKYVPYRFNGVTGGILPGDSVPPAQQPTVTFPGASKFGPGADNKYVAELGRMLIDRGALRFYPKGPSTKWSEADRQATEAFQLAQGWTGADADGIPGPDTWRLLVQRQGNDIVPTGRTTPPPGPQAPQVPPAPSAPGVPRPGPAGVPAYPGLRVFHPGRSHPAIAAMGRQLLKKGFGKYYTAGPGQSWTEADRRNVEAFQRAQGWRGAMADGYPGPETWRRLFA
ncbi:peptidoglycan-binding protein [Streptomyces katrae]|uniref:Membrane protein n=1 Tax=Streptomyces katrae TaxID=68223 RepID=A0A0F4J7S4_9ACTN|nr:peptidoglycan-binding protein [Streptomyces katrae]KJY29818.1 membrane protein [Streptomyces katrae]